jgi:hypothetical protein
MDVKCFSYLGSQMTRHTYAELEVENIKSDDLFLSIKRSIKENKITGI